MNIRDVARPRIWFQDVPEHLQPILGGLSGGHEQWATGDGPFYARDWDLLVQFGGDATHRDGAHLSVLAFGAQGATVRRRNDLGEALTSRLFFASSTHSRAVHVGTGEVVTTSGWSALLRRTIADVLPEGAKRHWTISRQISDPAAAHLVVVGEPGAMGPAALLVRRETKVDAGELLLLPPETIDHAAWLVAFLERLRTKDPARYPGRPDWRRQSEWTPTSLARAIDVQHALEVEKSEAIGSYDRRIARAASDVEQAAVDAAGGVQRLLTEKGDQLVEAVSEVLTVLGFLVRDMDAEIDSTAARLEDLRLTDPARPDWEALVEVKGYTKGVKASDVGQLIGKPVAMYAVENARVPSQLLLIVNGNADSDPSQRSVALGNDPASIELLRANNGVLIDTRDLFRAKRAVEGGQVGVTDVRKSVVEARGRWTFGSVL